MFEITHKTTSQLICEAKEEEQSSLHQLTQKGKELLNILKF